MKRFIPVTDKLTDLNCSARLVPYRVGMPCLHWEIISDRARAEDLIGRERASAKESGQAAEPA